MELNVVSGYDHKTVERFRTPESIAELVLYCNTNSHITFLDNQGNYRHAKVNGKVRTWKRNPNRVEIPIKYGMYEYAVFTGADINRVLIPLEGLV